AMQRAILSAPEILFVAAAGNSDEDVSFVDRIPTSIKAPNLLAIAAVDQAGDETSFTSFGPMVLHANGFAVESYVPGGGRFRLSGTSMAAPSVANLAAKILVLNPSLSPAQVIAVMRETAETTADGRRHLISPRKAIDAVQGK